MKNVYVIETSETCLVHKQYSVSAYTMEQAKDMILRGDLYDSGKELDHWIMDDLEVNEITNIKHSRVVEED